MLIGAGLSIVLGKMAGMLCIGIGIGIVIGVFMPRPAINISQTQNALPVVSQNQNASLNAPPEIKPIVKCLGVRTPHLRLGAFNGWVFYEDHEGTLTGAVVCFRNQIGPGQKGGKSAFGVTAHIVLRDSKGQEIGSGISRLCWVGRAGYKVDLKAGEAEARCALVLCHDQQNKGKNVTVPWKKITKTRWGEGLLDQLFIPDQEPRTIELTLLDGNHEQLLTPVIIRTSVVNCELQAEKL